MRRRIMVVVKERFSDLLSKKMLFQCYSNVIPRRVFELQPSPSFLFAVCTCQSTLKLLDWTILCFTHYTRSLHSTSVRILTGYRYIYLVICNTTQHTIQDHIQFLINKGGVLCRRIQNARMLQFFILTWKHCTQCKVSGPKKKLFSSKNLVSVFGCSLILESLACQNLHLLINFNESGSFLSWSNVWALAHIQFILIKSS